MGKIPNLAPLSVALQRVSQETLQAKYLVDGETSVEDCHRRVARAIASVETTTELRQHWEERFLDALAAGAVGGGRIMAGAGRDLGVTLINCFVEPIGDCMTGYDERGVPGIMTALAEAAETMRRGGGVGYNFSDIRPRGALVRGTGSKASGPLPYMDNFDAMCRTVESAGSRRGAQMGVLDVSHPDIEEFIVAKTKAGRWTNFNVSVAVTDAFMQAVATDAEFELVHEREPHPELGATCRRRDDGRWVYRTVRARELWDLILRTTYEYAEPGVLFIDRINAENNLWYVESIRATNPCAEEPLPPYGCCCLASTNLTRFVVNPFEGSVAKFDFDAFASVVAVMVRFLDNVLEATRWPLAQQAEEARNKRRIGQGFFGLGSAMMMLGLRYGSAESVAFTEQVSRVLMEAAYAASIDLAKERGAFPLFDAQQYLESGFAKRLPTHLRQAIAKHGIRNSHLLAIAPTGTMALSFGDNASNGIEPAFALSYQRRIRQPDETYRVDDVEDHAFRRFKQMVGPRGCDAASLPSFFVTTKDLSTEDHLVVMAAAQRFIDTSISKTVNCPADISFAAFGDVYRRAYELGCKSCTTYRPSTTRGAVLIEAGASNQATDPDRRLTLKPASDIALGSLRWPKRPPTPAGAPSWTMQVESASGSFGLTVAHYENGVNHPFECWVQGAESPRGLDAIAKLLSMDMRSKDRRWLATKLEALKRAGGASFALRMPPDGREVDVGSATAAMAILVEYRARMLGYFDGIDALESPMLSAMASLREPKTDGDGSSARYFDIRNDTTGDDFVLVVKEAELDGSRFPFSVWLAGAYPREWDGLCKLLSLDMRICDPKWIAAKLRAIARHPEFGGEFWAPTPLSDKQQCWPSTIAYIANVLLGRYRALGILDDNDEPIRQTGLFAGDVEVTLPSGYKDCSSCRSVRSVIRKDGCDFCTRCGTTGSCG